MVPYVKVYDVQKGSYTYTYPVGEPYMGRLGHAGSSPICLIWPPGISDFLLLYCSAGPAQLSLVPRLGGKGIGEGERQIQYVFPGRRVSYFTYVQRRTAYMH